MNLPELSDAYNRYNHSKKILQTKLNLNGEVKGSDLNTDETSTEMFKAYERIESFSVIVEVSKLYDYVNDTKRSRQRYADFILKIGIKNKLKHLISIDKLNPNIDTKIIIKIDEQNTASDGKYSFEEGIYEEFKNGIINFDYSTTHPPIFSKKLIVRAKHINSEHNLMIQATDNLSNRVWESYYFDKEILRKKRNHQNFKML